MEDFERRGMIIVGSVIFFKFVFIAVLVRMHRNAEFQRRVETLMSKILRFFFQNQRRRYISTSVLVFTFLMVFSNIVRLSVGPESSMIMSDRSLFWQMVFFSSIVNANLMASLTHRRKDAFPLGRIMAYYGMSIAAFVIMPIGLFPLLDDRKRTMEPGEPPFFRLTEANIMMTLQGGFYCAGVVTRYIANEYVRPDRSTLDFAGKLATAIVRTSGPLAPPPATPLPPPGAGAEHVKTT